MTSTDPAQQAKRLRAELATTLSELEDRANIPRRVSRRVRRMAQEKPVQLVLAGVGVAAAAAGVIWGVIVLKGR